MEDKALREQILQLVKRYVEETTRREPFTPGLTPVPVSGKVIGAAEICNLVEASLDGWLTTGRFNDAFERGLEDFIGVQHVLTVNSGSSANLVALSTLTSPRLGERALKPGDEVVTVAAGFPTTINPILQNGLVPVFVDVNIPTYNIQPELIEAAINDRTRAIMLAHTLGNPYDLHVVGELAKKYGLWLVEDCCDALGATYGGKMVGTFGDIGTLSFYPAHHITMGEGGAVFTNSQELKVIAESFRDWGRDCYCAPGKSDTCGKRFAQQLGDLPYGYDHKYTYSHLGYNLKITDMQAACGLAQLGRVADFITARRHNFAYLRERLKSCSSFLVLPEATPDSDPSWFGFPITLRAEAETTRTDLLRYLSQRRIDTRLLFAGNIIRQPYFKGCPYRISGGLEETDSIMLNSFWVGVYPALDTSMLDYVAQCLETYFGVKF